MSTDDPGVTYVLGAPGSGKTRVAPLLRALLPTHLVLDGDALMGPAGALAGSPIRDDRATWDAYDALVRAVVEQAVPPGVVLLWVTTPDQKVGWPLGRWVLLDCDDATRRARLAGRGYTDGVVADALADATDYRALGLPTVDGTGRTPDEVAALVESHVRDAGSAPSRPTRS